jgi:hypothetical protein
VSFSHRSSLLGSAVLAGLLVIGLGACSGDDDDSDAQRDESGDITEGGEADVFDIGVGDCMGGDAPQGNVTSVEAVPCDQPHDSEIYHSYTIPGDEFPGDMSTITQEQCLPAFQQFIGMAYEQSAIEVTTLEPTAESWEQGDRELLCVAVDPAGSVTGSLQGANR